MGNNTRRDGRVEPGQKIASAFSARAWNRAQDAADLVLGDQARFGAGPQAGRELAPNVVLIRNNSGQDVPWLGVLEVYNFDILSPAGGSLSGTDAASGRARQFVSRPLVGGRLPTGNDVPFVVCMEPVAAGAIGRAAVSGAIPCRVLVLKTEHRFAVPKIGDVTQLQSALCGPMRLLASTGVGQHAWALGAM